jgi:glycerate-2-kinase
MNAGADISEINAVRKHMSLVKGGRMARTAYPARVFALLLSDVPDDDPSVIASGPFSPDPATFKYAMEIIVKRGVLSRVPPPVCAYLESGISGAAPETPKHGDPAFNRVATNVIGSNLTALEAVSAVLKMRGIAKVRVLPGFLHGEARECARAFTAELRKTKDSVPAGDAAVLVAGGETAVTVPGDGKGGRCQEFSLSAAIEIEGRAGLAVLCAGTDGIDGPTEAAGAYADGSTCSRAAALGLDPRDFLGNNDSHSFFRRLSDLAITGPTGTNVADIAIGLAGSPP